MDKRSIKSGLALTAAFAGMALASAGAHAQQASAYGGATAAAPAAAPSAAPAANPIAADGTVAVSGFELPPSVYLSDAAKAALPREPVDAQAQIPQMIKAGIAGQARAMTPKYMAAKLDKAKARFGVDTQDSEIAGIRAVYATPRNLPRRNRDKILLNFPGGGFVMGEAGGTGMIESIPLAAMAGVKIVSITYRQAPEYRHPAALEDIGKVYRELLKTYKPRDIAIFGCSAGGALAAEAIAWFDKEKLPLPAATGIFCASGDRFRGGDSTHFARAFAGLPAESGPPSDYFAGTSLTDPLVSPVSSPALLAKFPPTLVITATRAMEMSAAVNTHRELVKAGANAELHVWDGLDHAFFYNHDLPESIEAFAVMSKFFARHLRLDPVK